jgi:hypothetical protein
VWWLVNRPTTGSRPSSTAAASSGLSSTTRPRWVILARIWETIAVQSASTRSGSRSAIASTSRGSTSVREAPSTLARTRRSIAIMSTRSPALVASAASSNAASIAASSRGASPTRPADVREVSSSSITRRSRSGRQVRTTTCWRRAVARQSIERTSSPMT